MSSSLSIDHQNNRHLIANSSNSLRPNEEEIDEDDDDDDEDEEDIDEDDCDSRGINNKKARKKAHGTSKASRDSKKTKGRVKIKMEFIENKIRRYTTFSKRKTGIMKKAHELSILTGTQVMLLVASETGHVYTFATKKLQPMITSDAGKSLIQQCLNSNDEHSKDDSNQSQFEETEFNYNVMPSGDDAACVRHQNSDQSQQDIAFSAINQTSSGFFNIMANQQQSSSAKNSGGTLSAYGKQAAMSIVANSSQKTRNGNGAPTSENASNFLFTDSNGLIINFGNQQVANQQAFTDNKYSNYQI